LFDVFSSIFLLEISCWMICCFGFGGILKDWLDGEYEFFKDMHLMYIISFLFIEYKFHIISIHLSNFVEISQKLKLHGSIWKNCDNKWK
jgi:hypothetical protein